MEDLSGLLSGSKQLIVVQNQSWDTPSASLRLYARQDIRAEWHPASMSWEAVTGKAGMAWGRGLTEPPEGSDNVKKEGDNKAPAGLFRLGTAFGYAEKPHDMEWPYIQLTEYHYWIDDPKSAYYNQLVDKSEHKTDLHWNSAETMLREDGLYRWGLTIEHNTTGILPGGGSAIFMHIWRGAGQGTEGCTAMPEEKIEALLRWLDPKSYPMLLQLPEEKMAEARYFSGLR